jgi:hypothetical protein
VGMSDLLRPPWYRGKLPIVPWDDARAHRLELWDRHRLEVALVTGDRRTLKTYLQRRPPPEYALEAIAEFLEDDSKRKWQLRRTKLMRMMRAARADALRRSDSRAQAKEIQGEIAARLGIADRTVRDALKRHGATVRRPRKTGK